MKRKTLFVIAMLCSTLATACLVFKATPSAAPAETEILLFADPTKIASNGDFFQACSLLTDADLVAVFGAPLESALISGGGVGETGRLTYDCMTDPVEPIGLMFFAFSIEVSENQAEQFFREDAALMITEAEPVDGLGKEAQFWRSEDGAIWYVNALRGNVYSNLQVSFWLEDSPELKDRVLDLARLILDRLFERAR